MLPFAASAVMGLAAWGGYRLLHLLLGGRVVLPLAAAVIMALVVYGALILKMRCFSKEELLQFPMGGRIVRLARL